MRLAFDIVSLNNLIDQLFWNCSSGQDDSLSKIMRDGSGIDRDIIFWLEHPIRLTSKTQWKAIVFWVRHKNMYALFKDFAINLEKTCLIWLWNPPPHTQQTTWKSLCWECGDCTVYRKVTVLFICFQIQVLVDLCFRYLK